MKIQFFHFTFFLFICLTLPLMATAQVVSIPEPVPPPFAVREAFELDPFYQQWIDVEGLPVVASAKVNPYALKEAAWQIKQMVGHRPDVLQVMAVNKARFSVIGHTELITEIPEYRSDPRPDFLVFRERGWGGSEGATISASEEYILGYPGVHSIYNVLIHEFAHGVHLLGLNTLDPTFDKRLKMTYETAMEKGLWQGTYASTDRREYWAEGSQAWFHPNSHASFDRFGNTRQALKTYDPGLAVLLTEVYGDHQWRYTPVTDRIDQPHLQGINPQSFPTFPTIEGWTELEALYRQLNKPYSDGGGAWVNLERYDPQLLPSLTKSNVVGAATCVIFVNLSRDDVLLYAVHSDGTETYWTRASPNFPRGTPTRTNSLWLVKDTNGRNIAVFQAEEKTGRALIPIDIAAPLSSKVVSIPDANLHAVIETALGKSSSTIITASDMGYLTNLEARDANISDLTGLEGATHLTGLFLGGEFEGSEYVNSNTIANLSPVVGLTNLTRLDLWGNNISDISALADLTNLTGLWLGVNSISDISVVADLTRLTYLGIEGNSISNISAVSDLTNLTWLNLGSSSISDLSALAGLTQLKTLYLWDNNISGLSPLVANRGLGEGDTVNVQGNPLSALSIYTHIPALQSRGVEVRFDNLKPVLEYLLSIPAGISLIHIPLKVNAVDGTAKTIESIADLYDALGGADAVNFLITYDSQAQEWRSYFGTSDTGTPADKRLTDDIGIIAGMIAPASIRLSGTSLGINGTSTITLNQGLNLVGLPLRDLRITRVSDLFTLEGIGGNVPVIILTNNGEFKAVGRARDSGDIEIIGGQSFIMTAQREAMITISGDGWYNSSAMAAAPPVGNADLHSIITGIQVTDTTPVLVLRGSIVNEGTGVNQVGTRITVKNLSTGRELATVTAPDGTDYRLAVVDIETGQAAQIGDILEISAQSPNPLIGVQPLRYTVTAEDVKRGLIQLTELVAYEIPTETELLRNYPNPFNPETWIPYRLAEDAFVTLTIYDGSGRVIRTLDVGHRIAAVYERRSKAVYWDGRNRLGEQVASGVYFYTLRAGDYSNTRKMVILK